MALHTKLAGPCLGLTFVTFLVALLVYGMYDAERNDFMVHYNVRRGDRSGSRMVRRSVDVLARMNVTRQLQHCRVDWNSGDFPPLPHHVQGRCFVSDK